MLNPRLFYRLEERFGTVKVIHRGEAMQCKYVRNAISGKIRLKPEEGFRGEEYKMNCPACGDSRGRLYINHRWGVFDERTGTRNLWLANCFNSNCFADYTEQRELFDKITGAGLDVFELQDVDSSPRRKEPVRLPGNIWPLSTILSKNINHTSVEYLRTRMVPPELAAAMGVGHCLDGAADRFVDRLIIPIYEDGKLVSWQARAERDNGLAPKYLFARDSGLSSHWYNFDTATTYRLRLIVEGVIDAWMAGPHSLGVFNKRVSSDKFKRLVRNDVETGKQAVYGIMLDPTQNPKDTANGQPHHMHVAYDMFRKVFGDRVFQVWLPEGTDPGSLNCAYIRALVKRAAADNKIDLENRYDERISKCEQTVEVATHVAVGRTRTGVPRRVLPRVRTNAG